MNAWFFTEVVFVTDSILDEIKSVDLGDERLNERLKTIAESFSQKPNMSILQHAVSEEKRKQVIVFSITPRSRWRVSYRLTTRTR